MRPDTFGYYNTQWRRWPGQGVIPVSDQRAATPVVPPKSEVPGADEESLGPKPGELPAPDAVDEGGLTPDAAAPRSGGTFQEPSMPGPDGTGLEVPSPTPTDDMPAPFPDAEETPAPGRTEPADEPPLPPEPEATPTTPETAPKPRPEDENLFDDAARRRATRRVVAAGGQVTAEAASVKQASHDDPGEEPSATATPRIPRAAVPRVPFDPPLPKPRPHRAHRPSAAR